MADSYFFIVSPSPSLLTHLSPSPQQSGGAQNLDSSGTLVEESTQTGDSNCYMINRVPLEDQLNTAVPQQTTKPRGAASLAPASGRKAKSRGVPVAPLKLDGDQPFSKAFLSPGRMVSFDGLSLRFL